MAVPLRLGEPPTRLNPDVITRNSSGRSMFPGTGAVHFSTRGEYGVRMMVELARHHGAGPISLAEMAAHEDLPRPYLEQLVASLREAGLVHSTRGARGGYRLVREPAEIRMGEVIRALEGPIAPMVCASEEQAHADACGRSGFCNVNVLWVKVRDAITGALDSVTLAELAAPRADHPYHPPIASSRQQPVLQPANADS
jgi:Rrf2 family transcriptional regulator, cysteine metabolism repressor